MAKEPSASWPIPPSASIAVSTRIPLPLRSQAPLLTRRFYFTTDGSEPSPTNGTLYSTPLNISTTTVLRAVAHKENFAPTNIDTQSYLLSERRHPAVQFPAGLPTDVGWQARGLRDGSQHRE